jgi:hypothetical protein
LGINDSSEITGYYVDSENVFHGFARASNGDILTFNVPATGLGANQGTLGESINDAGEIVGIFIDENNVYHGFVRTP